MLLFYGIDFPLTHDLDQLLKIIRNAGIETPADIDEAGILTAYAVGTR